MFVRAKEQRIARSNDAEVEIISGLWSDRDEADEIEVVCLECGHTFTAEDPDECEGCGSSDLDVA